MTDLSTLRRFAVFEIEDGIYEHKHGSYVLYRDVVDLLTTSPVDVQNTAPVDDKPAQQPTDQQIVDTLARHGIGWMYAGQGFEQGPEVIPYPLDGEDAPIYIGAVRELLGQTTPAADK